MLEKADKKYKNLDIMVRIHMDKLDNTTLYYYHYWRGISYMFSNKNATAREFFIKAKDYAPRNFEKAGAIANIGLTLKRNKQYDEALKYYQDALNYPDESRIFTTAEVYNYIAMLYKAVKDYPNALDYIQKALDIAEKENNLTYKLAYTATYVEIQLEMGNIKNYKSYFNVLLSTKGKQIHSKPYMLKDIKSFIEYINDIPCLDELIDIIMDIRNVASSIEYKDGLAECVGHAEIKIRDLTRGV
jgi:tetratricopeptide (TPR) repeat protein